MCFIMSCVLVKQDPSRCTTHLIIREQFTHSLNISRIEIFRNYIKVASSVRIGFSSLLKKEENC